MMMDQEATSCSEKAKSWTGSRPPRNSEIHNDVGHDGPATWATTGQDARSSNEALVEEATSWTVCPAGLWTREHPGVGRATCLTGDDDTGACSTMECDAIGVVQDTCSDFPMAQEEPKRKEAYGNYWPLSKRVCYSLVRNQLQRIEAEADTGYAPWDESDLEDESRRTTWLKA